jgi:hypothetical protein
MPLAADGACLSEEVPSLLAYYHFAMRHIMMMMVSPLLLCTQERAIPAYTEPSFLEVLMMIAV